VEDVREATQCKRTVFSRNSECGAAVRRLQEGQGLFEGELERRGERVEAKEDGQAMVGVRIV
jgi:hypothetical protein